MHQKTGAILLCVGLAVAVCLGIFLIRTEPVPEGQVILPQKEETAVSSDGWMTVSDAAESVGKLVGGVFEPVWIAYGSDLCRGIDFEVTPQTRVKPEGKTYFNKDHSYPVYAVEQEPTVVAILINGRFAFYRKHLSLAFEYGGTQCQLLYSPVIGTDYDPGELLLECEGYKVYEAVCLQETEAKTETYLVDATQLLKMKMPELFGSCGVFREFYWLAQPVEAAAQDSPVATGEVNVISDIWGGCYLDKDGKTVVLLTENTEENQRKVLAENPSFRESDTLFREAKYPLSYLQQVLAEISAAMGRGELPAVVSAEVNEIRNCVTVSLTGLSGELERKLQGFDFRGGALEFAVATHPAVDLLTIN